MKKLLALMLVIVLCVSIIACDTNKNNEDPTNAPSGNTTEAPAGEVTGGLADAAEYVHQMYKDIAENTPADYTLVTKLSIGDGTYTVTWTTSDERVTVVPVEGKDMVTVVIPDSAEEISYVLTATIADASGKTTTKEYNHKVPATNIVTIPEALEAEDGTLITVKGKVTLINTPWDDGYKNISVTISDEEGNELYLYRLSTNVELGDLITVKGEMATYNGARQVAQGATAKITGHEDIVLDYKEVTIPEAIAADDNTLVIVKGTVKSIDTAWSDSYKNISVTIVDKDGNELYIYRLSTKVEQGDVVTIKGIVGSYNGAKQIAQGATAEITGHENITIDYVKVTVAEAVAKDDGVFVELSGTVTKIDTPWSDSYGNISVTLTDSTGSILLYRLSTNVEVGDKITVKGKVGSYEGAKQIISGTAEKTGHDDTVTSEETTAAPSEPVLEGAVNYDFKEYETGVQYAENEEHVLDETLKVITNEAHFNQQIRLYHSEASGNYPARHATATFVSTKVITGLSINAGNKADTLKVSASVDGETWVEVASVKVAKDYANYNVVLEAGTQYKYIKLESTSAQIRVASLAVVYEGTTVTPPETNTTEASTSETTEAATTDTTETTTAPTGETTEASTSETTEAASNETTETTATETTEEETTVAEETTAAGSGDTTEPTSPYGTKDAPLSVSDALDKYGDLESGKATDEPCYVQGTVTSIESKGSFYKKVMIFDGAEEILIYSINMGDGITGFGKGDTIIAYGYIMNYDGTIELSSYKPEGATESIYVYAVSVVDGCKDGHKYTDLSAKCDVCDEINAAHTECADADSDEICDACGKAMPVQVTGSQLAVFEFGDNVTDAPAHKDGSELKIDAETYVPFTSGAYTLNITAATKVYDGACDEKGTSALKLGTSKATGSFSFTVDANVSSVTIKIAGYKANTAKIKVNGKEYEITTPSNNSEYTEIVIDTSSVKTVELETLTGGNRAMIDSITYNGTAK